MTKENAAWQMMIHTIISGEDNVPPSVRADAERLGVKKDAVARAKQAIKAKVARPKTPEVAAPAPAPVLESNLLSKAARARVIVQRCKMVRKDSIKAIMSELGMSEAGATTYFYNAKKTLKG